MISINSKLEQLIQLLEQAEKLASQFSGGYSNNFLSAQEFHSALVESINELKNGDTDQLNDLWIWFAPTCDWDDLIHQKGQDLANKIFPLVTELKKSLNIYTIVDLITDYQENVERVMKAFKHEFNRTDLLKAYRSDKLYPQVGELKKYQIKRYAFHGIGLSVDFTDNTSVDFDFAFIPEQRHDGFDLNRSEIAGLIAKDKKTIMRKALLEFLIHGLPYVFPQRPGALTAGIPTAHSAPPLNKHFKTDELFVWADSKGEVRGQSIEPFHHGQIKAAQKDKTLYELLALCDALRVGKARERKLAEDELRKKILK